MISIQNSKAIDAIREGARLSISEGFPQQLIRSVQPVMDMTPRFHRQCNIIRATTSTGANVTIYTTPTDKDFYLVGAVLSSEKDAASTNTYATISGTIEATSVSILRTSGIASTAGHDNVSINLPIPIKIDRGTNIVVGHATNSATLNTQATIMGYTVDTP